MRAKLAICTLALSLAANAALAQPNAAEFARLQVGLERLLNENIVPFWYAEVVDPHGGYRLNHDGSGQWQGPADKALVTQARTLWFFSRLYNDGYGGPAHLEVAHHGFEFLRERMWDKVFGGFFWSVDDAGEIATRPHKHLYAQGFALYALAEYIEATADSSAIALANEFFELLEARAHDGKYGGYLEWFLRDWQTGPQTGTYMGTPHGGKLMNTHLHLMEPLTTYYQVSGDERVRERLLELIFVQSNAVVRKDLGVCTDKYLRDWTPILEPPHNRVSYGHDIENVWLLIEAHQAAGLSNGPMRDLYRQLMDYSLEYGFDHEAGGFYNEGEFDAPADARQKVWWVQAEGLVAALVMYRLTGELKYWQVFVKTYDWIAGHQADWEHGDWHAVVNEDGTVGGGKAGAWKSPYHNGRAVLECLHLLEELRVEMGR
ncbi:MAG: AGE family epimerase/isomerase [Candidatus Latescibacterota bacterium]|nr:AGE family epimerase/isomerase [Candidatus Latescibacterota bacterium]